MPVEEEEEEGSEARNTAAAAQDTQAKQFYAEIYAQLVRGNTR